MNDVYVREHSFSGYWGQQIFFTDWLRFEGGLRGDFFTFDVNDRLPGQGADPNFTAVYLNGRQSEGLVSPKANLIVTPVPDTDIYLNFGEGFHSNDARAAIGGAAFTGTTRPGTGAAEQAVTPITRALGYELGARTRQFDRLDLASAIWLLDLDSELVFSGDAGTDEPSKASRRWGIDFEARYRIYGWLFADYDLAYADPRFNDGGAVPLAPTLLMNGGLTAKFPNGFSMGLRSRYLGDRPANEQRNARRARLFPARSDRPLPVAEPRAVAAAPEPHEHRLARGTVRRHFLRAERAAVDRPACALLRQARQERRRSAESIHFTPGNPFTVVAGVKLYS